MMILIWLIYTNCAAKCIFFSQLLCTQQTERDRHLRTLIMHTISTRVVFALPIMTWLPHD
jgi:hypothetical protein